MNIKRELFTIVTRKLGNSYYNEEALMAGIAAYAEDYQLADAFAGLPAAALEDFMSVTLPEPAELSAAYLEYYRELEDLKLVLNAASHLADCRKQGQVSSEAAADNLRGRLYTITAPMLADERLRSYAQLRLSDGELLLDYACGKRDSVGALHHGR